MKLKAILLAIASLLVCVSKTTAQNDPVIPTLYESVDKDKMNHWVDSVFNTMTLDEKIGQVIMIMAAGDNTESNRRRLVSLVKNQHIGNILFSKGNPVDQAELTNLCQQNAKVPIMLALDGEWGLSMRLEKTTRFPRNMMVSAVQDDSLVYFYGKEVARQCREMGIHINFAPDMDVNSNPSNPVIGNRSFGENPEWVSKMGILYSKGLESGRVMAVAKHFPGHGDTSTDSHKVLPLIEHNENRLNEVELRPFRDYIEAKFGGVMVGHLNIPAFDKSGAPSSLSKPIITDLLQTKMGFRGLIFTDGLAMDGVATQPEMSMKALLAGSDILVGPIHPVKEFEAIKNALEKDASLVEMIENKCKKILAYKYVLGVNNTPAIDTKGLSLRLNPPYAEWLTRKIHQKAITLLKNDDNLVPLEHLDKKKIAAISVGGSSATFHKFLKLYGKVATFNAPDAASLSKLKASLSKYNTLIVSVHSSKATENEAIQNIIKDKNSILVFFTNPYKMSSFSGAIKKADAVIMAYENSELAQDYAAQGIFGGNEIEGKLPVSVSNLFKEGSGIETKKTRLGYGVPEDVGIRTDKLEGIEEIVNEGLAEKAFPGCQVLVAKDGFVIYNRSFGSFEYNGKREVTNEDIYDIASMTKASATVPAIMKLYDEKKIALQSPLSKFVTPLKDTDKSKITVREALFHETGLTSFIPYYEAAIDKDSYSGRLFSNKESDTYKAQLDVSTWGRDDYRYKANLISSTPSDKFSLQIADNLYANKSYKDSIVQAIADSKLNPKKKYLYSCLNFILLKEAVEDIAKTDLNTFLQESIYEKLGATTTTFNPLTKFEKDIIAPTERDDFLRKQLLQGYVHDEGAAFMGGIGGNAGLFSNANDLAKLYQMWLNNGTYGGEQILSKETCRMFTLTKSGSSRRGLGFDKPEIRNNKSSPTSPSTPISAYGHTGFTGTCFWVDPDNNMIYIFLSNRVYEKRTNKKLSTLHIRSRIQEEIYKAIR